jgi:uncharacterized membrane protein
MSPDRPPLLPERGDKVTRLEAFVDAAFAFAVTLLVITGEIPSSIAELQSAIKQIPAYAASFALIMRFWLSHADWSRRYGMDDATGNRLSLLLVFVLLIFVYPLKMVFSSLFSLLSGGYLPTSFSINSLAEVPMMFQTFAIGFGSMALVLVLLFARTLKHAESLRLAPAEIAYARYKRLDWALVVGFSVLSFTLACLIPATAASGAWIGMPGFIFFGLNICHWQLSRSQRHVEPRQPASS